MIKGICGGLVLRGKQVAYSEWLRGSKRVPFDRDGTGTMIDPRDHLILKAQIRTNWTFQTVLSKVF